jgi:hypothetical protein
MSIYYEDALLGVNVSQHPNGMHVEYVREVLMSLEKYGPDALGVRPFFDPFRQAVNNEITALEYIPKSADTKRIAKANNKFDNTFAGMRTYTHSFLNSVNDAEVYAAENLKVVLDKYGNIARKPYRQELSLSHNLVEDLRKRPNDIQVINLTTWINAHEMAANELFALLEKRNEEMARQINLHVRKMRKETDFYYHKNVNRINSMINIHGKDYVTGFFDEFNQRATEYNNKYAQHIGRLRAEKEKKKKKEQEKQAETKPEDTKPKSNE